MTSQSPRKRPITPWSRPVRRTGISLAVLAGLALTAAGSDTPVGPAPTRWAPTPTAPNPPSTTVPSRLPVTPVKPLVPTPTLPTTTIPAPPPPAAATPHRVVVFQKPAGTEGTAPAPQKKIEPPAPAPTSPQPPVPLPKPPEPTVDLAAEFKPYTVLSRERVFQLTSDDELRKRVAQELYEEQIKREPTRKGSPEDYRPPIIPPVGKGVAYQTKVIRYSYPAMQSLIEPSYVVHRRLLFEEKNADRFGWDAGIVQPLISTAYFYKDVLLWPAHLASNPFERYDTSAGKCLPGDPVPYFLYPPEIDLFGGSVGAAAIVGAVFLFP